MTCRRPTVLAAWAVLSVAAAMPNADSLAQSTADRHPYDVDHPIDQPIPLTRGPIRTVNGIAFTPDGRTLFTSDWVAGTDSARRRRARIFEWQFRDGRWQGPHLASFSSEYTDYQPVMAPGGHRLYFQSTRPVPPGTAEVLQNIWFVEREGRGWGTPRPATDLNTPAREGYVAPLADGTIYFNSDRPGTRGLQDFYQSRVLSGGAFSAPVPVLELNTEHSENDLFVDPAGRFMIFNRYVEATREIDLYIAFAVGDAWGPARPLDGVNAVGWELTPSISPNGRYFFFTRQSQIYQIDLAALLYADDPVPGRRRRS